MNLSIFSFFAGAGFLDLGFESAGYGIDYVNELDQDFMRAYRYAREQLKRKGPQFGYHPANVTILVEAPFHQRMSEMLRRARSASDVVGFVAGPPCPDFSVAGKHKGRNGEKGRLTEVYVELIVQQHPDFFVFENVPGLWKTNAHRKFFDEMRQRLQLEADYVTTDRIVNALLYGVPQDRDRLILVGFRRGLLADLGISVMDQRGELPQEAVNWAKYADYSLDEVFNQNWPDTEPFEPQALRPCPENIIRELTVEYWFQKNNVTVHPNQQYQFRPRALRRFESIAEGDVAGKSFKRLHRWRYSPTAAYGNNEVHLHPYEKRRLSVAEALAIQSLPPEFCFPPGLSLSAMFKMVSNGVPHRMAQAVGRTIRDFLEQQ